GTSPFPPDTAITRRFRYSFFLPDRTASRVHGNGPAESSPLAATIRRFRRAPDHPEPSPAALTLWDSVHFHWNAQARHSTPMRDHCLFPRQRRRTGPLFRAISSRGSVLCHREMPPAPLFLRRISWNGESASKTSPGQYRQRPPVVPPCARRSGRDLPGDAGKTPGMRPHPQPRDASSVQYLVVRLCLPCIRVGRKPLLTVSITLGGSQSSSFLPRHRQGDSAGNRSLSVCLQPVRQSPRRKP